MRTTGRVLSSPFLFSSAGLVQMHQLAAPVTTGVAVGADYGMGWDIGKWGYAPDLGYSCIGIGGVFLLTGLVRAVKAGLSLLAGAVVSAAMEEGGECLGWFLNLFAPCG